MNYGLAISTTAAAILTLCIFSFLYKDNPFYKFAEHLVVGVSAGYWVVILYINVVIPNIWQKLMIGEWWYIIPTMLGFLMWTRLIKRWSWISRYPLAFYLGIATGVAIPLEMKAKIIEQLFGTINSFAELHAPGTDTDWALVVNTSLIAIGIISSLIYFFFSKEHKGVTGGVAKVGIWTLMIGFGASFGFTVMARISLLIERWQFLIEDWINPFSNFILLYVLPIGIVLLALIWFLSRRGGAAPSEG